MTDTELFSMLVDKPALRFSVARTESEAAAALLQYRGEENVSAIRRADRREELKQLLESQKP